MIIRVRFRMVHYHHFMEKQMQAVSVNQITLSPLLDLIEIEEI